MAQAGVMGVHALRVHGALYAHARTQIDRRAADPARTHDDSAFLSQFPCRAGRRIPTERSARRIDLRVVTFRNFSRFPGVCRAASAERK